MPTGGGKTAQKGETMYIINEYPAKKARENGSARFPEDFPHLRTETGNKTFHAWKVGEDIHVETTLHDADEIIKAIRDFEEENHD